MFQTSKDVKEEDDLKSCQAFKTFIFFVRFLKKK